MLKKLDRKNKDIDATKKISGEEAVEGTMEDTVEEDMVDELDEFAGFDDSDDDYSEEEVEEETADDEDSAEEDEADDDSEIEEDSAYEDEVDEEDETDGLDDLLTVINEKRKSKLQEGDYIAVVTDIEGEKMPSGKFGKPWIKVTFEFKIKNPDTGEYVTVKFSANKSLDPKSRLYPIAKGIWGSEPGDNFNLRELKGKKARVSIEHSTDDEGNVWDNIVAARKYVPKKK